MLGDLLEFDNLKQDIVIIIFILIHIIVEIKFCREKLREINFFVKDLCY